MRFTNENLSSIIDSFKKEVQNKTATKKDYINYLKFLKKINPTYKKTFQGILQNSGIENINDFLKKYKQGPLDEGDNEEELLKFNNQKDYFFNEISLAETMTRKYISK